MRKFDEDTGLNAARRAVLFTVSVLEASGRHARQAEALQRQLTAWNAVSTARRGAEDAVTLAHARVAWADFILDRAVQGLANEALRDAKGNREEPTFRELFPEPPSEVVRMGLEAEIARCASFAVVASKRTLSPAATAALTAVQAAMTAGQAALAARRAAFVQRTEAALDAASWMQATEAARQSVYVQLQGWALEEGEDRAYAERFFAEVRKSQGGGEAKGAAAEDDDDRG